MSPYSKKIKQNQVIATTKSVCPICFATLPASINHQSGKIFLTKICPVHGKNEILLSHHADYYVPLREYYFQTMSSKKLQSKYLLCLTPHCNMQCPICALGNESQESQNFTINEIKDLLKNKKNAFFVLFGAEPTCHKDLITIIQLLKKHQKIVYLYSNGLRFDKPEYLKTLRKSGIDKIYFQFDGFQKDTYIFLRGRDLLEKKIEVLENLKEQELPVVLNATIAKNLNEGEMQNIFRYALENDFVRAINFTTYERSGRGKDYYPAGFIMPDELIDIFVENNKEKITRKNIFLFQKLLFAYLSFFNIRSCYYIQFFWVIRDRGEYYPINEVLNLEKMEKSLDSYKNFYVKNKWLAKLYLVANIYKLFLKRKSYKIFKELLFMTSAYAFGYKEYAQMSTRFMQIIFSTGCDGDKIDYKIVKNCNNGIIYKTKSDGIKIVNSDGFCLVNNERKAFDRSKKI